LSLKNGPFKENLATTPRVTGAGASTQI